jgi:hypothetical protein
MATAVTISKPAAALQPAPALTRTRLLQRVLKRLVEARQRQADREMAAIVRRHGG